MTKKDPRFRRTLRALRGGDDSETPEEPMAEEGSEQTVEQGDHTPQAQTAGIDVATDADSVDGLEDAVAALESKLESGAGIDGLAAWLRDVEATVTALEDAELDRTRDDIRGVIDRLLGINAEIQNVVRLKKLLS